ncbi:MAG: PrsW family intramembrane metalloprotease [Dethiosulfatibacter sp.]|nr:PrsW family intramembrane metalloprotease [Dethiosulfatibacter sp.]
MNTNLIVTAVTPGIALAIIIYLIDRYDREPVGLLVKTFIGGAIIVIPTIFLESFLSGLNIFGGLLGVAYTSFIVAGFSEEFFKRTVVMKVAYNHVAFDEKLDGIIYCVIASLGFATVENIMYVVFRFPDVETVGLYRAFLSVPAHMLFGITMGYYLSLAKFCSNPNKKREFYSKSLYIPMILHGTFNFILLSGDAYLMFIFIPYIYYLWRENIKKLNKYYQESKRINTLADSGGNDGSECE